MSSASTQDYWTWENEHLFLIVGPPGPEEENYKGVVYEYKDTVIRERLTVSTGKNLEEVAAKLEVFLTGKYPELTEIFKNNVPKSALERIVGDLF